MNTTVDTHKKTMATLKATNTPSFTVSRCRGRGDEVACYCMGQQTLLVGYDLLQWLKAEAEMNKAGGGCFSDFRLICRVFVKWRM
jgi:hypothetical protein